MTKLTFLSSVRLLEGTYDSLRVTQIISQDSSQATSPIAIGRWCLYYLPILPSPGPTELEKQVCFPYSPAPHNSTHPTLSPSSPALPCPPQLPWVCLSRRFKTSLTLARLTGQWGQGPKPKPWPTNPGWKLLPLQAKGKGFRCPTTDKWINYVRK
jgi:hypothetical protein